MKKTSIDVSMITQIAATPIIKGDEAKKVFLELKKKKPNPQVKKGEKKLEQMFKDLIK